MKKLFVAFALILAACSFALPASAANLLYSLPSLTAGATLTSAISGTNPGAIDSGPTLTVNQAGTWSISGTISTAFSGATYSAVKSASCWLYRTNNTPGTVANTTVTAMIPIITTLTAAGPTLKISPVAYTTANTNDALRIYCSATSVPDAGEVDVTGAYLLGVRFK